MKFFTKKRGFTLLELLVSAAVLSLVSVIIAQVLFTTVRLNTRTELLKEMKQTGASSMDMMKRMIQNAQSVSSPCTGLPQSQLSIVNLDGGETTFLCQKDSEYTTQNVYRIASLSAISAAYSYVSSGNVTLVADDGQAGCGLSDSEDAALQFICPIDTATGASVTILFRLRRRNTTTGVFESVAETFQSTATMRNR